MFYSGSAPSYLLLEFEWVFNKTVPENVYCPQMFSNFLLPFLRKSTWWTSTFPSPQLAIRYLRIALQRCFPKKGWRVKASRYHTCLPISYILVNQYLCMVLGRTIIEMCIYQWTLNSFCICIYIYMCVYIVDRIYCKLSPSFPRCDFSRGGLHHLGASFQHLSIEAGLNGTKMQKKQTAEFAYFWHLQSQIWQTLTLKQNMEKTIQQLFLYLVDCCCIKNRLRILQHSLLIVPNFQSPWGPRQYGSGHPGNPAVSGCPRFLGTPARRSPTGFDAM